MEIPLIVAGALFLIWPLQYRSTMRRIRARISAREGDVARFDRAMDRQWIRVALMTAPIAGVLLIVVGIAS